MTKQRSEHLLNGAAPTKQTPSARTQTYRTPMMAGICAAVLMLAACGSDSETLESDDQSSENGAFDPNTPPSANIEPTRDLLEQAESDWQAVALQDYAYIVRHDFSQCLNQDGTIDTADQGPISIVFVPADDAPYQFTFEQSTYMLSDTLTQQDESVQGYEYVYGKVHDILDEAPVVLGLNGQEPDELPQFSEQGVLESLFYTLQTSQSQCSYSLATDRLVEVSTLDYPLHQIRDALEAGYQTWQDADLQDYTYSVRRISGSCEAPELSEPLTVRVVDGEVVEVEGDTSVNTSEYEPLMETLNFEQFANTLFNLPEIFQAGINDAAAVSFDPNFGYPLSFYAERTSSQDDACRAEGLVIESFN